MSNFYENIKSIRISKKLTQAVMSEKLEITEVHYNRIENDRVDISLSKMNKLAEIFGMTVIELLQYGSGVESVKEINNEKVKELENKVLLLEKDLEISRNRYELKVNEIENYIDSLFTYYGIIDDLVYKYIHQHLISFLKENLKDIIKIKEYLNSINLNNVLDFMTTETETAFTDQMFSGAFELLEYNNQDLLKYKIKNIYVAISLNMSFSQEKFNKLLEENDLLEYFNRDNKNYDTIKSLGDSLTYSEKVKPFELLDFEIKGLNQYKPNPNYPPQTGFFRIENL